MLVSASRWQAMIWACDAMAQYQLIVHSAGRGHHSHSPERARALLLEYQRTTTQAKCQGQQEITMRDNRVKCGHGSSLWGLNFAAWVMNTTNNKKARPAGHNGYHAHGDALADQ